MDSLHFPWGRLTYRKPDLGVIHIRLRAQHPKVSPVHWQKMMSQSAQIVLGSWALEKERNKRSGLQSPVDMFVTSICLILPIFKLTLHRSTVVNAQRTGPYLGPKNLIRLQRPSRSPNAKLRTAESRSARPRPCFTSFCDSVHDLELLTCMMGGVLWLPRYAFFLSHSSIPKMHGTSGVVPIFDFN